MVSFVGLPLTASLTFQRVFFQEGYVRVSWFHL